MNQVVKLRVKRLPHCKALPSYATPGSAGLDLSAAVSEPVELKAGERMKMPTGIQIEIPERHQGQVVPRSGLAAKAGISLTNSVGTIDSDYRGEVIVLLINHGTESYTFEPGERVAQLVVMPIPYVEVEEVDELSFSEIRGAGGFGSTGRSSREAEVAGKV
ncbi:MAG: dUTP diphosphatase [Candidatus Melainabacteria bacterium]|nr:dUTP diphosphatase [Candidatus Melainabacteria bacterium]